MLLNIQIQHVGRMRKWLLGFFFPSFHYYCSCFLLDIHIPFNVCYKMTPESYLCLCLLILNGPINDIPILCSSLSPPLVPRRCLYVYIFVLKKFLLTFLYLFYIYIFFGIHVVVESSFLSHVGIGLDPSFFNSFTNAVL